MYEKLAIHGGQKVFSEPLTLPKWPNHHQETEAKLIEIYRSLKWGMRGKYEQLLEKEFAAYHGVEYCVWMSNGTTTLECALLALGVGPGDEVIIPGLTWIATGTVVLYAGATPVIVDVQPDTLCIDPDRIEEAITPRTKAIIPVHLFSAIADMDRILEIAEKHKLFVIEDCAHAHGAQWDGKGVGSLGNVGSFSFQMSKLMTAGEGGVCTTSDKRLAERIFRLSHIGNSNFNPGTMPESDLLCRNYRFTEFQAAIIYDQLQHLEEEVETRIANAKIMEQEIKNTPGIIVQNHGRKTTRSTFYFPTFLLKPEELRPGTSRKDIFDALEAEGVCLWEAWGCPVYKSIMWNIPEDRFVKMDTPVSEDAAYNRIMTSLNTLYLCKPEQIKKASEAINKVMRNYTI